MKGIFFLTMIFSLSLTSCRQDDVTQTEFEKIEQVQQFQIFKKSGGAYAKQNGSISDQEAFRSLYYYYYLDNPDPTLNFKDLSRPHIDFKYASQVFIDEDSTRKVLYPFIEDGHVSNIVVASVNSRNSIVSFYFPVQNEDTERAIAEFSSRRGSGNPGFDLDNPALIEPVVIPVPPKRNYYLAPTEPFNPSFPLPPSGGCAVYNNCGGGGGGGGGTVAPPTNTIPPPPPPEIPVDIQEFLSCLIVNEPANLTVFAEDMFGGNGVGHAFISITQGNNTMTFGFYPKNSGVQSFVGPSTFADDSGHHYTHSLNMGTISPAQLQQIISTSYMYSTYYYDLSFTNCSDFALATMAIAGFNTNLAGIDTPNTVAGLIGGTPVSANAPQTNRSCP
ncbi:hypothetical protein [Chryseobacterium indoltheticum]|uniref:hypothetical protein n=1 Tax=Chryseobacterium indoltheticum TaxID=254 RepID=UPI004042C54F